MIPNLSLGAGAVTFGLVFFICVILIRLIWHIVFLQYPNDPGMHNSMDSHMRTSYRHNPTFFERVGSSLFGILTGIALLVAGSGLLFWNEVTILFYIWKANIQT